MYTIPYNLNIGGKLVELNKPLVMGILNVTPDSFYAQSCTESDAEIIARAHQIIDQGGSIIDVGACSTRPGAIIVSKQDEMDRLRHALSLITGIVPSHVALSVDTFRADVARMCVEEYGVHIINDISGGTMDKRMLRTVAQLGVPYVLTHIQGTPQTMQQSCQYSDLIADMILFFSERINRLRDLGQKDIIIDPGFGFGKSLEQGYELMHHLEDFSEFRLPLLVGVSRKSMIYQLLGNSPADALAGTVALQTTALMKGANIIRAHDVKQAADCVSVVCAVQHPETI